MNTYVCAVSQEWMWYISYLKQMVQILLFYWVSLAFQKDYNWTKLGWCISGSSAYDMENIALKVEVNRQSPGNQRERLQSSLNTQIFMER